MCRSELDLSQLPANTTQIHNVNTGKGRLVVLVTLNPCSGVSITDLGSTTSENPFTSESNLKKYVSVRPFFFNALILGLDKIK